MKMLPSVALLSLTIVLLASCGPLPPLSPTQGPPAAVSTDAVTPATALSSAVAPTAIATGAPAVPVTAATQTPGAPAVPDMGADPLSGAIWEWSAFLMTSPATQAMVPDPATYTLVFDGAGTVLVKADCNVGRGAYTLENETLSIEVGALTRAACKPGSLSNDFLDRLGEVGSYMIDGEDLVLRLTETDDSLLFRPAGSAAQPIAPAPSAAPSEPVGTVAPAIPTESVTPTQPVAPAEPTPVATETQVATVTAETAPGLTGVTWKWEESSDSAGVQTLQVADPTSYTVTFGEDGTVEMQADCNRAVGDYVVDGANLTIGVGPITLAMCSAESLGERFLVDLTSVATFDFKDGKLLLDLAADGGTMVLGPTE